LPHLCDALLERFDKNRLRQQVLALIGVDREEIGCAWGERAPKCCHRASVQFRVKCLPVVRMAHATLARKGAGSASRAETARAARGIEAPDEPAIVRQRKLEL
jgi:hypothetical protein